MTVQASLVVDDQFVGLEGLVSEVDEQECVRIYISGSYWPAKTMKNQRLKIFSKVKVIARHGITLIVEPV